MPASLIAPAARFAASGPGRGRRGAAYAFPLLLLVSAPAHGEPSPLAWRSVSIEGLAGQNFRPSFHGFSEMGSLAVEVAMTVGTRLELGLDIHPLILISQPQTYQGGGRETVPAAAVDAVLRWYPAVGLGGDARPYLELAEGPFYARRRVPTEATRWNFLTQIGAGLVLPTGKRWWTVVGYRWFHISNANLGERNPDWNYHALLLGGRLFIP